MGKAQFIENHQLVAGIIPVDLATAANNGDWVSLKLYGHVTCVLYTAAGTAGDDPIFKMQQATAVAGTSAKDLLFDTIYTKAVVGTAQTSIGQFTKVTQAAATSYTDATHAEIQKIYVVEFDAEDLDTENGFDCIQMSVADVGAGGAQIGCGFYILSDPRYTPPPSAIVD